ncbi:subtilase-type protease inhibitor [Streptomyces antimicrobicus]|uniref:Probable subtilase-type protease inhibitor n=1 Tax=Streptomyces antimicrobicus TaxID=2883108 RepID=A0ABS8B598_9ACTN|nr:subtilase-type protease inhibitor [Streptomyces antimicrobicus]MCB5179789.1 subtilase-type protease inhibitor [Streptomyces antimicrobicus]
MRHRRVASVSAAALLCLAGAATATGVAEARPTSLYAPSALVLTVAQGDNAAASTVVRAVTLSCAPSAQGTHPDPAAACASLKSTGGTFDRLLAAPDPNRACPMLYAPVTVTMDGVWQGSRVSWKHTFANSCTMAATVNGNAALSF